MNDILILIFIGAIGLLIGIFFFGGLNWTVRKSLSSKQPAYWFISSFIIRFGITFVSFYFISGGHWERLMVLLTGFIISRYYIISAFKPVEATQTEKGI